MTGSTLKKIYEASTTTGMATKDSSMEMAYYLIYKGQYDEALSILGLLSKDFPTAAFWAGYCFDQKLDSDKANYWYKKAESAGFVMPTEK